MSRKEKASLSSWQFAIKMAKNMNYHYLVEYDAPSTYNHDEYNCNPYCRCGVIENPKVTEVCIDLIIHNFIKDQKDIITNYCIDRVVRGSGMLDKESWDATVECGYYGEEVTDYNPSDCSITKICNNLAEMEYMEDIDRVKKLLTLEYGFLLPKIEKCKTAKIIEVSPDDIQLANDQYTRKLSEDKNDYYKDYDLPRAICTKSRDKYRVCDGYHRIISAKNNKKKTIQIIVLE
jgi:hypothetical protein